MPSILWFPEHRIDDLGAGLNLYSVKALADRQYLRNADDLTFNYHMIRI